MNGDHDAKCVGARSGALSLRCGASDIKRYAARTGPRKSNLTQNSGFAGSSFLGPSCCTPSFDEAIAKHHRAVIGELDRQLPGHRWTPRPSKGDRAVQAGSRCRRRRDAFDNGSVDASAPPCRQPSTGQGRRTRTSGPTCCCRADVGRQKDRWAVEHLACVWLRRLPPASRDKAPRSWLPDRWRRDRRFQASPRPRSPTRITNGYRR